MNQIEKWAQLCDFLNQIVQEVTKGDAPFIKLVLDRHKKSSEVIRAREEILERIRSEIWELHNYGSPDWDIVFSSKRPSHSWRPLGYLSIARILGGDHSAWVKMRGAVRRRKTSEIPVGW